MPQLPPNIDMNQLKELAAKAHNSAILKEALIRIGANGKLALEWLNKPGEC